MNDASMNLLAQYLSAAGLDLLSGKPIGQNVAAVTQQQVAARSYANLLKQLLAGGGKMTVDKDNLRIKAPTTALSMTDPYTGEKLSAPQRAGTMTEPVTGIQLGQSKPTNFLGTLKDILVGGFSAPNPQ